MASAPTPLPSHAVSLLLQYLTPLDNPIPSHLLSAPLRQRHHFLGLDPQDDALAYLSWPSSSSQSSKLYSLLAGLPSPEDVNPLVEHATRYTHDGETYFAHVNVDSPTYSLSYSHDDSESDEGLRLIFRWEPERASDAIDGSSGWKYHDVQTMPFPENSYASISEATNVREQSEENALHSISVPVPSARDIAGAQTLTQASDSEDDDDDYWNSYGGYESGPEDIAGRRSGSRRSRRSVQMDDEKAEDAYWAQYSSVQGTADSTIPTPPPQGRRRLHDPSQPLPLPDDFTYNPKQLSPNDLAYRLQTLSPRQSPSPAPSGPEAHDILMDNAFELASPLDTSGTSASNESATVTPPPLSAAPAAETMEPKLASPHPVRPIDAPFLSNQASDDGANLEGAELDEGLQQAIRGVYALWSSSRSRTKDRSEAGDVGSDTLISDKDAFVRAVRRAIDSL